MRISRLWRHAIPAASLVAALHAGTALACPGFPNATENCGLTFVALGQESLGTAAEHLSLTFDVPVGGLFGSSLLGPAISALWSTPLTQETIEDLRRKLDDADKAYQEAHEEFWRQWHEARERAQALSEEWRTARDALEQLRLDDPDAEDEIAINEQLIDELRDDLHDELNYLGYDTDERNALAEFENARDDAWEAWVEAGGEVGVVETAAAGIFDEDASPDTPPPPPPAEEPSDIESVMPDLTPFVVP